VGVVIFMMVFQVIVFISLLVLLVGSVVPWISVNISMLGRLNFTFFDIFNLIFSRILV